MTITGARHLGHNTLQHHKIGAEVSAYFGTKVLDTSDPSTGWSKKEATVHFAEYLENYQRYLHDFLHTSRLVYAEYVYSLQVQ